MPVGPSSPELNRASEAIRALANNIIAAIDAEMIHKGVTGGIFVSSEFGLDLQPLSIVDKHQLEKLVAEAYLAANVGWAKVHLYGSSFFFKTQEKLDQESKISAADYYNK